MPFWRAAALMRMIHSSPHLALALLAVSRRVGQGVQADSWARLMSRELVPVAAFGVVEKALVAVMGGYAPLDACHRRSDSQVRQQPADLIERLAGHDRLAVVAASSPRRLELEVVAAPRLDADRPCHRR
jgi:hypothetical protein